MIERGLSGWGPGISLRAENFGAGGSEGDGPLDRFAARQDAILHLNGVLAETDAEAAQSLDGRRAEYLEGGATGLPDFVDAQGKLLQARRKEALSGFSDPELRDEMAANFDGLADRHLRRAIALEQDARVRGRAAGAEQALGQIKAAALADPDGLTDRIADAQALLGRMVEVGVDANAAAERAREFRDDIGTAVLDDLVERDPIGALGRLDNGTFDSAFGEDQKRYERERLERLVKADAQAARRQTMLAERTAELERGARRRSTVGKLSQILQSGDADESHIARALYRGEIDSEDAEDLRARLRTFDEERINRVDEIERFDIAVKSGLAGTGDVLWEPATVDRWWAMERERGTALPNYISDCFGVSRHIPQPYLDDLRKMILSASADESVMAGREFRGLREQSADAADAVLNRLPEREARDLEALADYVHLDLPPGRIEELFEQRRERPEDPISNYGEVVDSAPGKVPPAPSNEPVDLDEFYEALDYKEDGDDEFWNAMNSIAPSRLFSAYRTGKNGIDVAEQAAKAHKLSRWEMDAFRHAYWSYKLSSMFGSDVAKKIGDAHERGLPENERGEALMDLYNNHIGRQLYLESRGKPGADVNEMILDALRSGRLQPRPFEIKKRTQ